MDNQVSAVAGTEKLLEDLEHGVGGVMGRLTTEGRSTVIHQAVPDLVGGDDDAFDGLGAEAIVNGFVDGERERWAVSLNGIVEEEEEE